MKHLLLILFILFSFSKINAQIHIGETTMDYEIVRGGVTLKMNGGGVRPLLLFDLYSAGLYLKEKSKDPIAICYENETMSIRMKITSTIVSRDIMVDAIKDGFENATNGNITGLEDRIELINKFYSEDITKGDILEMAYVKDKGVICMLNKNELGVIPGQDFKFALYKIWLGDKPLNKKLKKRMLGI